MQEEACGWDYAVGLGLLVCVGQEKTCQPCLWLEGSSGPGSGQQWSSLSVGTEQVPIVSLDTEQHSTIRDENYLL